MYSRFFPAVLITFILISSYNLQAQESKSNKYPKREFIRDFKNGVLLVRLQDKSLTLKTLKERGMAKESEDLAAKQRRENQEIILSFSHVFSFCPVYFFYAQDSEAIRNGDYESKVFNAQQQSVSIPPEKHVFTAEFGETENLGIDGLIISDSKLLKLEDPLPYFERRYAFFGLVERSKARMIERYNKKLYDYAEMYGL